MKALMKSAKALLMAMCLAVVAGPMMVSCTETIIEEHYHENEYDDSELWEKVNLLIGEVFDLKQNLNAEIKTLKDLLKGMIYVKDVSTDPSTGITVVTLSNGETLVLFPEKSMKSYVTYLTLSDGVDYWAYIDADGKKQLFLDENGEAVPVLADTPEVIEKDGDAYIVIGGVEYPLSGNSVFSDYEVITDELTGEVYAVTFTFGEGMSFTVTVDGAAGFHFVRPSGWSTTIISDYFVPMGTTERIQVEAKGVVDYVLQIPDGWRVKEFEDPYMGTLYFDVTAPSAELVKSGVAAADGDLKVVAVLEGGKASVAKLYLSTAPFKEFAVSLAGANVKMYNGLQKFVYGICPASEYDEAAIFDVAEGLLTAYDYPAGYGVADYDFADLPLEEVAGQALVPGQKYVFWAIPALYYQTDEDAGYYLKEDTFQSVVLNYASISFEIGRQSFKDAELVMDVKGVEAYYAAVVPAAEFYLEDVLYGISNGYYEKTTEPMSYTGSVFAFAGVEPEPSTEYIAWIAVAEDGKSYTESDLVVREFATLSLTSGSNVKVEATVEPQAMDVAADIRAAGAESIYYAFLTATEAKKYADDEARAKYLFEKGSYTAGTKATANAADYGFKLKPEMDVVLMAVATDASGKYGEVLVLECKTTALQYNDLAVEVTLAKNDPDDVQLNISVSGGDYVEYLYWIGKISENTWKSPNYLGGSAETAQVYMYLNPSHSRFTDVMNKYPVENGLIKMTDLAYGESYVIVAMAKDASGLYSKATEFRFTPRAVGIGNVVTSSDPKWEAARPNVIFHPEKSYAASGQMSGSYMFEVIIPEGYTGYVLAGTDSYLNDGDETKELTIEETIVKVIQYVDKPRDSNVTVDYDLWGEKGWPYGYEFYHHQHGNPLFGNVTIWASKEYHDGLCTCGGEHTTTMVINGVEVEIEHVIHVNDGNPVEVRQPYAVGSTTEVIDKVFVVCQDQNGNCYETFKIDVPVEVFMDSAGRGE
jgi:hypothetical protein